MIVSCPHCQAIWGFEEIEWQSCDACGYPEHDSFEEERDDTPSLEDLGYERIPAK
jgi:Zn ribbon nucleic-acid-binding protein